MDEDEKVRENGFYPINFCEDEGSFLYGTDEEINNFLKGFDENKLKRTERKIVEKAKLDSVSLVIPCYFIDNKSLHPKITLLYIYLLKRVRIDKKHSFSVRKLAGELGMSRDTLKRYLLKLPAEYIVVEEIQAGVYEYQLVKWGKAANGKMETYEIIHYLILERIIGNCSDPAQALREYLIIKKYFNEDIGYAWIPHRDISKVGKIPIKQIKRNYVELAKLGLITYSHHWNKKENKYKNNRYVILPFSGDGQF